MSRVFVATEVALGRQVVVKVLLPELAAGVSVDRFRREIQLAAQLQHPHIVPLLTAGESSGLPYFTMPFVDGESLRARLHRDRELPVAQAIRLLRDVASALDYAHGRGVVHRDIKPDNVLLTHGVAVVTDFGVAKALTASAGASPEKSPGLTSMGVTLGTPAYMAPEQASADPAMDHRVDVYAFGIMAYEMLTGQPPFAGRSPQAILGAHLAALPEPVTAHRPGLPPGAREHDHAVPGEARGGPAADGRGADRGARQPDDAERRDRAGVRRHGPGAQIRRVEDAAARAPGHDPPGDRGRGRVRRVDLERAPANETGRGRAGGDRVDPGARDTHPAD